MRCGSRPGAAARGSDWGGGVARPQGKLPRSGVFPGARGGGGGERSPAASVSVTSVSPADGQDAGSQSAGFAGRSEGTRPSRGVAQPLSPIGSPARLPGPGGWSSSGRAHLQDGAVWTSHPAPKTCGIRRAERLEEETRKGGRSEGAKEVGGISPDASLAWPGTRAPLASEPCAGASPAPTCGFCGGEASAARQPRTPRGCRGLWGPRGQETVTPERAISSTRTWVRSRDFAPTGLRAQCSPSPRADQRHDLS